MAKDSSNNGWGWLLVAAGVGLLWWRSIIKNLAYRISNIYVVNVSAESITLNATVEVYNPTSITAQVGNFVGNVYINSQLVGVINYPVNRYIYAREITQFIVGVTLDPATVGNVLYQQLLLGNIMAMDMDIVGSIEIDNRAMDISAHFIMEDFWSGNQQ